MAERNIDNFFDLIVSMRKRIEILERNQPTSGETIFDEQIDYTTTPNIIYFGEAAIGSATSAPVWRITRYDTTLAYSGIIIEETADGDTNFDNIWDDYLTLSYS